MCRMCRVCLHVLTHTEALPGFVTHVSRLCEITMYVYVCNMILSSLRTKTTHNSRFNTCLRNIGSLHLLQGMSSLVTHIHVHTFMRFIPFYLTCNLTWLETKLRNNSAGVTNLILLPFQAYSHRHYI